MIYNVNLTGMVVNRDSTSYKTSSSYSSNSGEVARSSETLLLSLIVYSFLYGGSKYFEIT